jgi:hypothetical protein
MLGFTLDLRWNEIGPSGATALIGMLEKNRTLKDVQLSGNNIPSSLQSEIGGFLGFLFLPLNIQEAVISKSNMEHGNHFSLYVSY